MKGQTELLILMGLRARRTGRDGFSLTAKFVEGMNAFAKRWEGPVTALLEVDDGPEENLDPVEVFPGDGQAFGVEEAASDPRALQERIGRAAVLHANLHHTRVARACAASRTPVVYVSESTRRTLAQSFALEIRNPIRRARKLMWLAGHDRECRANLRPCAGLQCNGTPTFDAHRSVGDRRLLFFDSRISPDMVASDRTLEARTREMLRGGPLRLAFTGRLIPIKGPTHLVDVALELRRLGVAFTMDICGGGEQEAMIRSRVRERGLGDAVRLRGVLDFRRELMPLVTQSTDLFVCCHPQGDPSCTYLETMACGVPIVGYDNEAFAGIVRESGVGWTTPLGGPREVAARIASLAAERDALAKAAFAARDFARANTFDRTMDRRVEHLERCSDTSTAARRAPAWT